MGDQVQSQKLDNYEDEERFTLEFVSIEDAIKVNKNHNHGEKQNDDNKDLGILNNT